MATGLFLWVAQLLPLDDAGYGADWRKVFWGAWQSGRLEYSLGLNNPPWTLWGIWPFALLPFRVSWALWTLLTVAVLIISVPPRQRGRADVWLILALLLSFWTLRLLVEGNLAALVVGGVLLTLNGARRNSIWQVSVGLVLLTAKVQEVWLFFPALAWSLWKAWPIRRLLLAIGGVLALILPSLMVSGSDWLTSSFGFNSSFVMHAARTVGNAGWLGVARGADLPPAFIGFVWLVILAGTFWLGRVCGPALTREKAAFLIVASLLLSPYSSGASLPVLLALGLIPLWRNHFWLGLVIWLWGNSPYLSLVTGPLAEGVLWPDWVQLILIVLIWAALGWSIWRSERRTQ